MVLFEGKSEFIRGIAVGNLSGGFVLWFYYGLVPIICALLTAGVLFLIFSFYLYLKEPRSPIQL